MSDAIITGCLSDSKSHRRNSALPGHLGSAVLKISIFLGFERLLCKDQSCRSHGGWSDPTEGWSGEWEGQGASSKTVSRDCLSHSLFCSDPVAEVFPLLTGNKAF